METQMKPGARVLCINDNFSGRMQEVNRFSMQLPVKGTTYTVRSIDPEGLQGILLVEIVNPLVLFSDGIWEPIFKMDRFRVLVDHEQDEVNLEPAYAEVVTGKSGNKKFSPNFSLMSKFPNP